jgi:hypothetical protein
MGYLETHWAYFSDATFEVTVGERGYNCFQVFGWGTRTNYVLDLGGAVCGGSGGSPDPMCYVNGSVTSCPPILCHFLSTCEPCAQYGCLVPKA